MPHADIQPYRKIQFFSHDFAGLVAVTDIGTLKNAKDPTIVPTGRFWFPIRTWMRQVTGGPITSEVFQVQIQDENGFVISELMPDIVVPPSGSASWPATDQRAGATFDALPPVMLYPLERWNFSVLIAVAGDEWKGRFEYLEAIAADPQEAWSLYYQYTRGTRELTEIVGARRG